MLTGYSFSCHGDRPIPNSSLFTQPKHTSFSLPIYSKGAMPSPCSGVRLLSSKAA